MRRQRIAMVQTVEQYVLVHRAVRELFQEQVKNILGQGSQTQIDPGFCMRLSREISRAARNKPSISNPNIKKLGKMSKCCHLYKVNDFDNLGILGVRVELIIMEL